MIKNQETKKQAMAEAVDLPALKEQADLDAMVRRHGRRRKT